jgi:hypothetical protein
VSVVLNEGALRALLETQEGPVGQFVEGVAQRVTAEAQRNVRSYFGSAPGLNVDQDVDFDMDGSTATVGIRDAGSKSRRLAQAQAEGRVNWLSRALEAGRE